MEHGDSLRVEKRDTIFNRVKISLNRCSIQNFHSNDNIRSYSIFTDINVSALYKSFTLNIQIFRVCTIFWEIKVAFSFLNEMVYIFLYHMKERIKTSLINSISLHWDQLKVKNKRTSSAMRDGTEWELEHSRSPTRREQILTKIEKVYFLDERGEKNSAKFFLLQKKGISWNVCLSIRELDTSGNKVPLIFTRKCP